jgi:hypothetical protein
MLAAIVVSAWQMARALIAAEDRLEHGGDDADFMRAKIVTARFYAEHVLPRISALRDSIVEGAGSVTALAIDAF